MSILGRGANEGASESQECLQGSDRFRIKQKTKKSSAFLTTLQSSSSFCSGVLQAGLISYYIVNVSIAL